MEGKVVAITGGLGAHGPGVAREAVARGAQAALIDAANGAGEVAGAFVQGGVDLTDSAAAERAFAAIKQRLGRIDALLNIAGGFRWEPLAGGDLKTWDFLYRVNVLTAATACKAALPYLAECKGAIVNVSAFASTRAAAGMGAYAASKAGVAKLTEALAAEQRENGVRVNAVLPSIIDTAVNRKDMPDADFKSWVTVQELA